MGLFRSIALWLSCTELAVAALAPLITAGPEPHLEQRQVSEPVTSQGLSAVIWTPSGYGTRSYSQYTVTGYTIGETAIGGNNYWEYCLFSAATCQFYTACTSGVRLGPNSARSSCEHPVYPSCGTQLLVRNTGAGPYTTETHPWCFPLGAASSILYYENSPTEVGVINTGAIITGSAGSAATSNAATLTDNVGPTTVFVTASNTGESSSGSSSTSSSTLTPDPSPSSTPVGAIVGGAVGGVAVLAIVAGVVVVLLHRRKQDLNAAALAQAQQPYPAYDPKHVSQNMTYYPPPGSSPHYSTGPHELSNAVAPQAYQNFQQPQGPPVVYEAPASPVQLQSGSPSPYKP